MMDIESLLVDVQSLEQQLAVLKAQLKRSSQAERPKTFADLYGIWAGQSEIPEEDLEAVKYRFEWDGEEFSGAPQ
jgi:hypothetical protein